MIHESTSFILRAANSIWRTTNTIQVRRSLHCPRKVYLTSVYAIFNTVYERLAWSMHCSCLAKIISTRYLESARLSAKPRLECPEENTDRWDEENNLRRKTSHGIALRNHTLAQVLTLPARRHHISFRGQIGCFFILYHEGLKNLSINNVRPTHFSSLLYPV